MNLKKLSQYIIKKILLKQFRLLVLNFFWLFMELQFSE